MSGSGTMHWRWLAGAAAAVLVRPALWFTALRQVFVLARPGWWRRAPWLPLPDAGYLRFRFQTAYGDPDHEPEPRDVVTYLHWCRAWPRVA
ncbi:MAG: hypothetical protein MUF83_15000 [Acidimicrobiales bacterium]|nr:hypothetical protein [Acidimicrobiales bacterium]